MPRRLFEACSNDYMRRNFPYLRRNAQLRVIKMHNRKGISPLIAAVLLIAFTMAIAGIMATWATQFSTQKIEQSSAEAECIGVLDIGSLSYSNGTISVRVK